MNDFLCVFSLVSFASKQLSGGREGEENERNVRLSVEIVLNAYKCNEILSEKQNFMGQSTISSEKPLQKAYHFRVCFMQTGCTNYKMNI